MPYILPKPSSLILLPYIFPKPSRLILLPYILPKPSRLILLPYILPIKPISELKIFSFHVLDKIFLWYNNHSIIYNHVMTLTINRYFYLVDYYLISNYTSLYCYFLLIGHKNNLQSIHYCYYVSHRKTILQAQCYFYQIVK